VLRAKGYQTVLYTPFKPAEPVDALVFEKTGFSRTFYGVDHNSANDPDRCALKQLSDDLASWTASGQRFVAAFYPQLGHGPWSPSLGATIQQRGHRLAMEQLDWLEGLVKQLQKAGQLEHTVIVVTGDHGVRTAREDPRVRVGMVNQYSLHVPLLIYAPNADYRDVDPELPSSHVDVAAELNQLFGIPRGRVLQGLSFQHPAMATRRQFFMGGWYYGADGYRDNHEAAMYSKALDAAFVRKDRTVDFDSHDLVRDPMTAKRTKDIINGMLNLQDSWIDRRVCGHHQP
jgi:arylsulfatase A-like enzyme